MSARHCGLITIVCVGTTVALLGACNNPFNIQNRISYSTAMRDVASDPAVIAELGWPVRQDGAVSLTKFESNGGTREDAVFSTRVIGPKGTGRVSVQSACVLDECTSQFSFTLLESVPSSHLEASTKDRSGVSLTRLDHTEEGLVATIDVPRGVGFKVYPAGSPNTYTAHDVETGPAWPAVEVDGPISDSWVPGPFTFTVRFDHHPGDPSPVHVIEGEQGFADTEHGVSFYSVPVPFPGEAAAR